MIDPFHEMRTALAGTALVLGGLSFVVHLAFSFGLVKTEKETEVRALMSRMGADAAPVPPAQIADVLKAAKELIDSLVKAGPALWSMIGSLLFLLVACVAAGVFQEPPEALSTSSKNPPATQPQSGPTSKHVEPPQPVR